MEMVFLQMAGVDAMVAQVLSICTIIPRVCLYDITHTRRLGIVDDTDHIESYERKLQSGGIYAYAQITVTILYSSTTFIDTEVAHFQNYNITSLLQQADPVRYGMVQVSNPTTIIKNNGNLISSNNNNNSTTIYSNTNTNADQTIYVSLEQLGLILLGAGWFICIVGYIFKFNKRTKTKISPDPTITTSISKHIAPNSPTTIHTSTMLTSEQLCKRCFTPHNAEANYCAKCGEKIRYPPSSIPNTIPQEITNFQHIQTNNQYYPTSSITPVRIIHNIEDA